LTHFLLTLFTRTDDNEAAQNTFFVTAEKELDRNEMKAEL
jgi:hypothetical protein